MKKRLTYRFATVRLNRGRPSVLCYVKRPITCTTAVQFWGTVTGRRQFFAYAVIER